MDPFSSFMASVLFSCSPGKEDGKRKQLDKKGKMDKKEDETYTEEAIIPPDCDSRDDVLPQLREKCASSWTSVELSAEPTEETEDHRDTASTAEGPEPPVNAVPIKENDDKSVTMEQLVLRALAATIPGSSRPKLDIANAPPPPAKKSILGGRSARDTLIRSSSGRHESRTVIKEAGSGLYRPPSVQYVASQELYGDDSTSVDEHVEVEAREDDKTNSKKILPWRRLGKKGRNTASF